MNKTDEKEYQRFLKDQGALVEANKQEEQKLIRCGFTMKPGRYVNVFVKGPIQI